MRGYKIWLHNIPMAIWTCSIPDSAVRRTSKRKQVPPFDRPRRILEYLQYVNNEITKPNNVTLAMTTGDMVHEH
jgi:hypothetical protein